MSKPKFPKLKGIMASRGETLDDLAKVLGITRGAVSFKLNGKTSITLDDINKICQHYNLSYDELFT